MKKVSILLVGCLLASTALIAAPQVAPKECAVMNKSATSVQVMCKKCGTPMNCIVGKQMTCAKCGTVQCTPDKAKCVKGTDKKVAKVATAPVQVKK